MTQLHDPDEGARDALRLLGGDPPNWVPDRPGIDHNVAIIGGGQTGCALAWALRRAGIGKVTILEAAPNEQRAGIWLNAARMNLLRTPKACRGRNSASLPSVSRHGSRHATAVTPIKRSTASCAPTGPIT